MHLRIDPTDCTQTLYDGQKFHPVIGRKSESARKLLLHKYEIRKLGEKIREKGYTLMPLQVYLKGSLVKVEIGLAKGKKLYDKRADIAAKDAKREAQREFKIRNF